MEPDWREFEKLVARIERALAPAGAVVKADDRIVDKVTGQKRQVDASIRFTLGTTPILITVECRKRKYKQDDTWIEQLITKKEKLGAATTIAVASKDISEQAKRTASFYGIQFRRISEISQDEILGWLKITEVVHTIYHPRITNIGPFAIYGEPGDPVGTLHPNELQMLEADPGNAQVFVRSIDRSRFSAKAIFDEATHMGLDFRSGVPRDGRSVGKKVVINFSKGIFTVNTTVGQRDLAQMMIDIDVHTTVTVVPFSDKAFSYTGSNIQPIYGVESKTELLGKLVVVSVHKQEGSDILLVTIEQQDSRSRSKNRSKGQRKSRSDK